MGTLEGTLAKPSGGVQRKELSVFNTATKMNFTGINNELYDCHWVEVPYEEGKMPSLIVGECEYNNTIFQVLFRKVGSSYLVRHSQFGKNLGQNTTFNCSPTTAVLPTNKKIIRLPTLMYAENYRLEIYI